MKEKEVGIGIVVIPESRICGVRVGMAVGSSKEIICSDSSPS